MSLGLVCQRRACRSRQYTQLLTAHKLGYWECHWEHGLLTPDCPGGTDTQLPVTPSRELWALTAHWALKKSPTQQCECKKAPVMAKVTTSITTVTTSHTISREQPSERVHDPHFGLNCELRLWDLQMRLLPYHSLWCEDSAVLCCTWPDLFFPPTDLFSFLLSV